jgi:hypothetical protein
MLPAQTRNHHPSGREQVVKKQTINAMLPAVP